MADEAFELLNFQQEGLDYLYHLEPTQNNLFWVGDFQSGSSMESSTAGEISNPLENSQFRIQSLSFDGVSLEGELHPQTKLNIITGVTRPESVSVTWIEDAYRSVQKYHMNWLNCWYDRQKDCFKTGDITGKLRSCTLKLFHFINGNTKDSESINAITQLPSVEVIAVIKLKGLIPASFGNFEFTMGDSGASSPISMNYKFTEIEISYKNDNSTYFI